MDENEHGPGCGCIDCAAGDQVCPTCGCIVGGGCPDSTDEEREAHRARHEEIET